jgi:hypothetical protein
LPSLFDLCLAWNWEHDADFVQMMDKICATRGLTLLSIPPQNLDKTLAHLADGEVGFHALLDRASEAEPAFLPIVEIARATGAMRLNPRELADRAYDKALIHQAFLDDGIPTPQTLILPAFLDQTVLPYPILFPINKKFAIKPALGGGGEGVIMNVLTLDQVQAARAQFPGQQYLLQEQVTPGVVGGLPAWFRIIYCLGEIYPCYWDVKTHVYTPLHPDLEERFGLGSLRELIKRIARICQLDLFSTEIALTEEGRLLVVDYVNDPIDLRLQSRAMDGVPDFIIERIAIRIAEELDKKPDGS